MVLLWKVLPLVVLLSAVLLLAVLSSKSLHYYTIHFRSPASVRYITVLLIATLSGQLSFRHAQMRSSRSQDMGNHYSKGMSNYRLGDVQDSGSSSKVPDRKPPTC